MIKKILGIILLCAIFWILGMIIALMSEKVLTVLVLISTIVLPIVYEKGMK